MSVDYNAKLIAELYVTNDARIASHICDEMVSIGDAIFPQQIYAAYKRFKKTSYSHYFVSDLTEFNSNDAAEILKEIARTTERDADLAMMVGYLTDIGYFEPDVVERIFNNFIVEISSEDIDEYSMEEYFDYLKKSGKNPEAIGNLLRICFENDNQDLDARKLALKKLLRLDPKKYVNFYYENYNLIQNKKAENIFVEEISTWKGGIVPTLHSKILEIGSERAKEILREVQTRKIDKKSAEAAKEQSEIKDEYQTADVISDISNLRTRINKTGNADNRFGFPFFLQSEELYQQGKPARDKAAFVGACIVLRSVLGGFSREIAEFEISEQRARELIPDLSDSKGSINKFHLFLLEKDIEVDHDIFGLRNINRIVSKFAHPNEEVTSEFLSLLKQENLHDLYVKDNWSVLHREILLKYKMALEKILEAIGERNS